MVTSIPAKQTTKGSKASQQVQPVLVKVPNTSFCVDLRTGLVYLSPDHLKDHREANNWRS